MTIETDPEAAPKPDEPTERGSGESSEATALEAPPPCDKEESVDGKKKKKAKGKIKFESTMQRQEAVTYFRALVDGLETGHLHFKQGEESLELDPSGPVAIELKASVKGDRQKVSFELEWRTSSEGPFNIET